MNLISKLIYSTGVKTSFYRLSVRQKILCSYGLALLIAFLGTTVGLVIGDRYYQEARDKMALADEEGSLLSSFQGALLGIHCHQQELVPFLEQPQALDRRFFDLKTQLEDMEKLVTQLRKISRITSTSDLQALLSYYDNNITVYFQKLLDLNQQFPILSTQPKGATRAQVLILEFSKSQEAINYYQFAYKLNDYTRTVKEREEEADIAQNKAARLQAQIIIASMLLSAAIATILALYTSKIITRPIDTVTNVARRVTQEANFDLEAPVTTKDEIGALASALNQLIQQVKLLLAAQQAETQTRLIQSEKMSSLGRMLASVAHEINNPVNFISGNLVHAQTYVNNLLELVQTYKNEIPHPSSAVQEMAEEIDLEFLEVDAPKLFSSMIVGADRTKEIVRSLKDFSRFDEAEPQLVDIHACIDSTLLILNNRLKNVISVVRSYGEIPPITGYTGLLYQVFMNLLSNAIDAIEEKSTSNPQFSPQISIITERKGKNSVVVRIADNGPGIAPENLSKIFENFFTTKPRGVGTGLGLAITYEIVVEKHGGKIDCHSELNQGTELAIALPITRL